MKKKIPIFCVVLTIILAIIYNNSSSTNLTACEEVQAALEDAGYQVTVTSEDTPLLQGEPYQMQLNGTEQFALVYVYDSAQSAAQDAATIDEDGCGINRVGPYDTVESICISWVDAPHFFLYENIIVQYIGKDWDVLVTLRDVCGDQIAGLPFVYEGLV